MDFLQSSSQQPAMNPSAGIDPVEAFLQSDSQAPMQQQGFGARLSEDMSNRFKNETIPTLKRQMMGEQGIGDTTLQLMGNTFLGGASDLGKEAYNSLPDSFTGPTNASIQSITQPVAKGAQGIADLVDNTSMGKSLGNALMNMSPTTSANVRAIGNVASGAPILEGGANAVANTLDIAKSGLKMAASPVVSAIAPFTESGKQKIAAAIMASSAADPQTAASALKNAPEYIPQSYPTTGPASGDTGLLSLERTLRADPNNYFAQRIGQQNVARNATMQAVAGNESDIAAAKESRSAATSPLYESAGNVPIAPDTIKPVIAQIDGAIQKAGAASDLGKTLQAYKGKITSSLPSMEPVNTGLVDEGGSPITRPNFEQTQQGPLSQIYREERDQLQKTGMQPGAYGASVKGVVTPINYELGKALEAQSPELKAANQDFANRSTDINHMQNMQELNNKLVNTGQVGTSGDYFYSPAKVGKVMQEGGLNTPNGWQDFNKALDPNQQHYLSNLSLDLNRDNLLNSPEVKPSGSPTYSYMEGAKGFNTKIGQAMTSIPYVGSKLKGMYANAGEAVKNKIIAAMLDPRMAAEMILKGGQ